MDNDLIMIDVVTIVVYNNMDLIHAIKELVSDGVISPVDTHPPDDDPVPIPYSVSMVFDDCPGILVWYIGEEVGNNGGHGLVTGTVGPNCVSGLDEEYNETVVETIDEFVAEIVRRKIAGM